MALKELIIPPTTISLLTTNKCTAACKDCCSACNPKNKDRLTLEEMKDYIDQNDLQKFYSLCKEKNLLSLRTDFNNLTDEDYQKLAQELGLTQLNIGKVELASAIIIVLVAVVLLAPIVFVALDNQIVAKTTFITIISMMLILFCQYGH